MYKTKSSPRNINMMSPTLHNLHCHHTRLHISGRIGQPISSGIRPKFFPYSFSVSPLDILKLQSGGNVHYLLETSDLNNAMYYNDVNQVICTENKYCNKRISCAGLERSAGRPGNRPTGARTVARNTQTCLGPYATRTVQSLHTGHNTRDSRQASSRRPRPKDQDTSQPRASSSRRSPAAEDHASPVTVALHPRGPPYFCGDANDDVHL